MHIKCLEPAATINEGRQYQQVQTMIRQIYEQQVHKQIVTGTDRNAP